MMKRIIVLLLLWSIPANADQNPTDERTFAKIAHTVQTIKSEIKDPDSLKFSEALLMKDGTQCYNYRAKNSFGGYVSGSAMFTDSVRISRGQNDYLYNKLWNKVCAGQGINIKKHAEKF